MKAEEIYAVLDRIRSFVQYHTKPDGSFPANSPNIGISLELCETVIHEAYEKENGKTGIVIDYGPKIWYNTSVSNRVSLP